MKNKPYTTTEERLLVKMINDHLGSTGHVQWRKMETIPGRDTKSMSNHWQGIKKDYRYNGNRYILRGSTLFDAPRVSKKKDKPKTSPVNKRVKVSRSFFWGAVKVTRYE